MDTDTEALCGHKYTTKGRRVFSCTLSPHPRKPDNHYYERDLRAEDELNQRPIAGLIVTPGARRG